MKGRDCAHGELRGTLDPLISEPFLSALSRRVSIWQRFAVYPDGPLFHPSTPYPEYPFDSTAGTNRVYEAVRESFRLLGLDDKHYGTRAWNPLGALIRPGDHVLVKPNLIREGHGSRSEEWEQVITHPSIIRAVLDYIYIALQGSGRVVVADGPQTDSDFAAICDRTSLAHLASFFRAKGLDVSVLDLRRELWLQQGGVTYRRCQLAGDSCGYTTTDLGQASEFRDYSLSGRFYGADYDVRETAQYHCGSRHAYVLCRSVMDADVIINLPKMKTHKKTGVTLSLKNMVGVNGHRNCLPHYTIGRPSDGGDEFPDNRSASGMQSAAIAGFKRYLTRAGGCGGRLARAAVRVGRVAFGDTRAVIRSGNWSGNDTLWRTVLDLNKILFHFGGSGQRRRHPLRYLTLVDGIVAGEGDGPSSPDSRRAGVVVAGLNPAAVDTVCATIMGFDFRKIPLLSNAWRLEQHPLADFQPQEVTCLSNISEWCGPLQDLRNARHLGFRPHFGWTGCMERDDSAPGRSGPEARDGRKGAHRS